MNTQAGLGLFLAVSALISWSFAPFFFTATGRIIGPFATNLLRLSIAAPLMIGASIAGFIATGVGGGDATGFPNLLGILTLSASGILGLAVGDLFLYRSLFRVGPERSSLFLTLAPAFAATLAWFGLRETLNATQLGGMALILGGVFCAVWSPGRHDNSTSGSGPRKGFWYGASAGITAAVCQAVSSVMVRQVFLTQQDLSPLYATTVRITAAATSLLLLAAHRGEIGSGFRGVRMPRVLPRLLAGTFAGPIVGMTCYIAAMKYQPAGVVITITFMTPLLIMPLGAWHYGTQVSVRAMAGAVAALAGIVVLGLNPG